MTSRQPNTLSRPKSLAIALSRHLQVIKYHPGITSDPRYPTNYFNTQLDILFFGSPLDEERSLYVCNCPIRTCLY
ncbi:MAG: hypothetical protein ICV85_10835 [Tolypothrix sp. T3-bin4]|nr:hypothetical protein [Tolypothrix sp. Co-bin9]MBD0302645.1 hypothetical protein [Tolypothrix sp. T3-bin4]